MQQTRLTLVQIICRYHAPLQRYACRLVKDQAIAAAVVKIAFEQVYELNGFYTDCATLRKLFKELTYKLASCWLLLKPVNNPLNN